MDCSNATLFSRVAPSNSSNLIEVFITTLDDCAPTKPNRCGFIPVANITILILNNGMSVSSKIKTKYVISTLLMIITIYTITTPQPAARTQIKRVTRIWHGSMHFV